MPVELKKRIETMISRKVENNPGLAKIIKAKLIISGIDLNKLTAEAIDNPLIIAKLEKLEKELCTK